MKNDLITNCIPLGYFSFTLFSVDDLFLVSSFWISFFYLFKPKICCIWKVIILLVWSVWNTRLTLFGVGYERIRKTGSIRIAKEFCENLDRRSYLHTHTHTQSGSVSTDPSPDTKNFMSLFILNLYCLPILICRLSFT